MYTIEMYDVHTEKWVPHSTETFSTSKEAETEIIYLATVTGNAVNYRVVPKQ